MSSDEFNNRLMDKVDKTSEDITEIKIILAKQEQHLGEHIRRTALAEERIELLYTDIQPLKEDLSLRTKLKELTKIRWTFVLKVLSIIVAIVAAIIQIKRFR